MQSSACCFIYRAIIKRASRGKDAGPGQKSWYKLRGMHLPAPRGLLILVYFLTRRSKSPANLFARHRSLCHRDKAVPAMITVYRTLDNIDDVKKFRALAIVGLAVRYVCKFAGNRSQFTVRRACYLRNNAITKVSVSVPVSFLPRSNDFSVLSGLRATRFARTRR